MMRSSVAVIMAGGKSSRMQRDKALLPFGEYASLAQFQYARLSQLFSKVYISAKWNKFDFEVNIIEDNYEISSPLVALVSILETLEVDEVFVLSVDSPFVSQEVIEQLYANAISSADVIIASSKEGLEPLCAIYRRTILKEAYESLEVNNHRLQALLKRVETVTVSIENEEAFWNLNYPSEYEEATLRVGR